MMTEKYAEMLELLQNKRYSELMRQMDTLNPIHCAEFFEELERPQQIMVFRMLKKDMSAEIFAELSQETMENIIRSVSDNELSAIIEE
ncbi:MAG: magnesium transporter, partial [Clostridia bacterium]|nr:magnesium transporter [Clostridia bacterium]